MALLWTVTNLALVEEAVIMATIVINIRLVAAAEAEETRATIDAAAEMGTAVIARLFVMRESRSRNRNNKQQQRLHVVVEKQNVRRINEHERTNERTTSKSNGKWLL